MAKSKKIFVIGLVISIIATCVLICIYAWNIEVNTLIGIEGISSLLNHLYTRLNSYMLLVISCFVMLFIYGKILIIENKKCNFFGWELFCCILLLCCYSSRCYCLKTNIGISNFWKIDYFEDINLILKCKDDIANQETYTINCNYFEMKVVIVKHRSYRSTNQFLEYEVKLCSKDRVTQKTNVEEIVYVSERDFNYIRQLSSNVSSRSSFNVTIYKNTKLIQSIEKVN